MQSPYKRGITYDLETGGTYCKYNSITEIALVAFDFESLEIVEEFSVMLLPRIDLTNREADPTREAKQLFKLLKSKNESGVNVIKYKDYECTLRSLEPLIAAIEEFYEYLEEEGIDVIDYDRLLELEKSEQYKDIIKVYFDKAYHPQALEVTHISREDLEKEGVSYEEAYRQVKEVITRHTVGNSKPVIVGHNTGSLPRRIVRGKEKEPDGFDNPFMEIFFNNNNDDWFDSINELILDTLKLCRIRWTEMPSFSLGVVANELGITLKEAHRALPDTIANARVMIQLLRNLRGEGSQKSSYKRRKFDMNF